MFEREQKKSLAFLSESVKSASQTMASVDSQTCSEKELKPCWEEMMEETNLLNNSIEVSPVVEIT